MGRTASEIAQFIAACVELAEQGDDTVLEKEPLEEIAQVGQLVAYKHKGFWQPMDTLRDKSFLDSLWKSGKAPWKFAP